MLSSSLAEGSEVIGFLEEKQKKWEDNAGSSIIFLGLVGF